MNETRKCNQICHRIEFNGYAIQDNINLRFHLREQFACRTQRERFQRTRIHVNIGYHFWLVALSTCKHIGTFELLIQMFHFLRHDN